MMLCARQFLSAMLALSAIPAARSEPGSGNSASLRRPRIHWLRKASSSSATLLLTLLWRSIIVPEWGHSGKFFLWRRHEVSDLGQITPQHLMALAIFSAFILARKTFRFVLARSWAPSPILRDRRSFFGTLWPLTEAWARSEFLVLYAFLHSVQMCSLGSLFYI